MEKLRFEFTIKAAADEKSNIFALTSITTLENKIYIIPEEYQPMSLHVVLINTTAFKRIKNTINRRHQVRRIWITLTKELSEVYLDEDLNLVFKDFYLEELVQNTNPSGGITEEGLKSILNSFSKDTNGKKREDNNRNLKKLSEKFVLEKFTNKNANVTQWIELFENECTRLTIEKDEEKIENLRLFLEGSCLDWYSSMLIKFTLKSVWKEWKKSFCDTYADKGWTPVKYAFSFKYINGALLDYALKKERLLLEINKNMEKKVLVDIIATGLPDFITDKINRTEIESTEDFFNELRSLEHLTKKKFFEKKKEVAINPKDNKLQEKKPCRICEKKGKSNRYHLESTCWFKTKEFEDAKKNSIKSVNNSEIEAELSDVSEKNY